MIEHPIAPVADSESKVLVLGSFPSVKSREQGFFYGHPQNRLWRVLARVVSTFSGYQVSVPGTTEEKKAFLHANHIAMWDVIASCDIEGSSDTSIKNVTPNDIASLVRGTGIGIIYCNGSKAYSLYRKYIAGTVSIPAVCLPSTSPANAGCSLEELTGAWLRVGIALNRSDFSTGRYMMNSFIRDNFGMKLYKLALDGGFTCPNRDGTCGTQGCIFCDGDGSGHFAGDRSISITEQLQSARALVEEKLKGCEEKGYIAYFQAFTGTYDTPKRLRRLYSEAAADRGVKILSIATRPDCLGPEVLGVLKEMNEKLPVWVELGLQTRHERTAELIGRGYGLRVYEQAIRSLHRIGITQIITHVILGLPGESREDMLETVKYVAGSGATGIKLQLLHVLKNTRLAGLYAEGAFRTLGLQEYVDLTADCVSLIPPDMVIHRLTGDGDRQGLIAPLWSTDKKRVLNAINARLDRAAGQAPAEKR